MKIFLAFILQNGEEWGGGVGREWGSYFLVPWLCLATQIRRLCLQFCLIANEAEPLDIGSPAEPGNE